MKLLIVLLGSIITFAPYLATGSEAVANSVADEKSWSLMKLLWPHHTFGTESSLKREKERFRRDTEKKEKSSLTDSVLDSIDFDDPLQRQRLRSRMEQAQNKQAAFNYGYSVRDEINDGFLQHTQQRSEGSVSGEYAYSDGYFRHKVRYVADDKGFRVLARDTEPIGDGPVEDEGGRAIVQQVVDGVQTRYAIQAVRNDEDDLARMVEIDTDTFFGTDNDNVGDVSNVRNVANGGDDITPTAQ